MVNKLDEERLCLCPPMKLLTNSLLNSSKEPTVLGGILLNHTRASPLRAHDFVWNPLKMHCSLESCNMITWVTHSIIRVQGRHLELRRQGVAIDGSCERGVYSMNQILYGISLFHVLPHLMHNPPHLVHLLLQMWHTPLSDTS